MFYGVSNWNAYLDGVLYINSNGLQILQVYLRNLFSSAGSGAVLSGVQGISDSARVTEETLKMVTISVSIIPILIVYPYIQKYYTSGITTGAVKE
jgi:putative aldouronate transport system permease protein